MSVFKDVYSRFIRRGHLRRGGNGASEIQGGIVYRGPEFERQMQLAEDIMRMDREVLQTLSK